MPYFSKALNGTRDKADPCFGCCRFYHTAYSVLSSQDLLVFDAALTCSFKGLYKVEYILRSQTLFKRYVLRVFSRSVIWELFVLWRICRKTLAVTRARNRAGSSQTGPHRAIPRDSWVSPLVFQFPAHRGDSWLSTVDMLHYLLTSSLLWSREVTEFSIHLPTPPT